MGGGAEVVALDGGELALQAFGAGHAGGAVGGGGVGASAGGLVDVERAVVTS
jgi:hypothetical protein